MLLIGSRLGHDSSSETSRFARSSALGSARRPRPVVGLLSWGSSIAPSPIRPSCVHTRLGRRPDFGSGLPRPEHVPFLPFLPASTVSSAEGRSEDPPLRRPAGLLHPATGHGVHHVSDSLTRPLGRASTRRSRTRRSGGNLPRGAHPSKLSPPRQPSTMPSPRVVLSDSVAFTGWRALSPFRAMLATVSPRCAAQLADLRAFFRRGVRCKRATFPLRARSMLPWALDRLVSRCCRAFRAAQTCWTFRLAGQPLRRPRPERQGKARCFGLVWLRATDGRSSPKERPCAVAVAPAPSEEGTSAASHKGPEGIGGMPVDQPEGESTASVQRPKAQGADVIATHLRRDSCATQCSLRRAAPVVRASAPRP